MTYGQGGLRLIAVPAAGSAWLDDDGFSSRDLIALSAWMDWADRHGYGRLLIERGSGRAEPEHGDYVLIYAPGCDWATWGVGRSGAEVVVWHCRDGVDFGRFPTMMQALERLPPVWAPLPGPGSPAPQPFRGPSR